MAVRSQRSHLGNTQSQPRSVWWDTDTNRIYVFSFQGISFAPASVSGRERETVWWRGGGKGGTGFCHSKHDLWKHSSSSDSPSLQVWSVHQPFRPTTFSHFIHLVLSLLFKPLARYILGYNWLTGLSSSICPENKDCFSFHWNEKQISLWALQP